MKFKYNNNNKNNKNIIIFVYTIFLLVVIVSQLSLVSATDVTGCTEITSAGTYTLASSFSNDTLAQTYCIKITANDVTFDGQNNQIASVASYIIYSNGTNTTIKNTLLTSSLIDEMSIYAIYLNRSNSSTIINNQIFRAVDGTSPTVNGIYSLWSNNVFISNNVVNGSDDYGIVDSYGTGNNITNNRIQGENITGYDGIYIDNSYADYVINNSVNEIYAGYSSVHAYGIEFYKTDASFLINNTVQKTGWHNRKTVPHDFNAGIAIIDSNDDTLLGNIMLNNEINLYVYSDRNLGSDQDYYHTIDTTNLANGYKIYYNHSISDYIYNPTTSPDAAAIMCPFCDNITIEDYTISDYRNGKLIFLDNTDNSLVNNIITLNNSNIIYSQYGTNNKYYNIDISDILETSNGYGIILDDSNSIIINCTIDNLFNGIAIELWDSDNINITNGYFSNALYPFYSWSTNNVILKDSSIDKGSKFQSYIYVQISKNISFLNVNYVSGTYGGYTDTQYMGSSSIFYRKWYLSSLAVKDGTTLSAMANVNISNLNATLSSIYFSSLTNSSGNINNTDYISYEITGGVKKNYNLSFSATSYYPNSTNYSGNLNLIMYLSRLTNYPNLTIIYPTANNMNFSNNQLNINFTVADANLSSCWYSNDTMSVNTTITCGTNITDITWVEGQHNVTIWVNNSANNINSTTVRFTIDTINPNINITYPSANNMNFSNNQLDINYTVSDANLKSCWYSNDTMSVNTTLASCTNITTIIWSDAKPHNITIWANDYAGNINSSSISFTIDTTPPSLTLVNPKAQIYPTNESLSLDYIATDAGVGVASCWFKVTNSSDGSVIIINNQTLTNCQNTTFNVTGEGLYNLTLYANDTLGHLSNVVVKFSVSLTGPAISLDFPTDNKWFNNGSSIYFNFTATDADGISMCRLYSNWSGSWSINYTWIKPTNATMNFTTVNLADGLYLWTIWCNDTNNNVNYALNNFTIGIDSINPSLTITSPVNGSAYSTSASLYTLPLTYLANDTNRGSCIYNVTYEAIDSSSINGTEIPTTTLAGCNTTTFNMLHLSTVGYYYYLTLCVNDSANNINCSYQTNGIRNYSVKYSLSAYVEPGPGSPPSGGGGGGSTSVQKGYNWSMKNDAGGNSYILTMLSEESREKLIILKNYERTNLTINIKCEDVSGLEGLCKYVSFDKTKVVIPPALTISTSVSFTITLPDEIEDGKYYFNIVGSDILSGEKVVSVEVDAGSINLVSSYISHVAGFSFIDLSFLSENAKIFPLPKWLILLVINILIWALLQFLILRKLREKQAGLQRGLSFMISIMITWLGVVWLI